MHEFKKIMTVSYLITTLTKSFIATIAGWSVSLLCITTFQWIDFVLIWRKKRIGPYLLLKSKYMHIDFAINISRIYIHIEMASSWTRIQYCDELVDCRHEAENGWSIRLFVDTYTFIQISLHKIILHHSLNQCIHTNYLSI